LHNIGDIDSDNFISPNDSFIADSGERFDYILPIRLLVKKAV
jgi:type I restriction enzyme M protein